MPCLWCQKSCWGVLVISRVRPYQKPWTYPTLQSKGFFLSSLVRMLSKTYIKAVFVLWLFISGLKRFIKSVPFEMSCHLSFNPSSMIVLRYDKLETGQYFLICFSKFDFSSNGRMIAGVMLIRERSCAQKKVCNPSNDMC